MEFKVTGTIKETMNKEELIRFILKEKETLVKIEKKKWINRREKRSC